MKLVATTICLLISTTLSAAEWGTISGKIVLKGDVPEPELLHAKGSNVKDNAVCAKEDTYKADLVVDKKSKGISNVFIYLYKAPKSVNKDEFKKVSQVIFDQEKCMFKPHAMVVHAGQTVEVLNSDPIAHNTHTYPVRNDAVNILVTANSKKGSGVAVPTASRESVPHPVKCDYHPWMTAYWLVVDHPYAAVTDKEGNFKIKNLPVGEHEFRIWHERPGYVDRKYKVTVEAGENSPLAPYEIELSKLDEK